MTDTAIAADDDERCDHLLQRVGAGDREALGALFSLEAGRLIDSFTPHRADFLA